MLSRFLIAASLLWTQSAFAAYAAIAYSPSTGLYGYSAGLQDADSAQEAALGACQASDCEVAGFISNGFIALATDSRGSMFIGSSSQSRDEAMSSARSLCRQNSRHHCTELAWAGAVGGYSETAPSYPAPSYPAPSYPAPSYPSPNQSYEQESQPQGDNTSYVAPKCVRSRYSHRMICSR